MLLDIKKALAKIDEVFPEGKIQSYIEYKNLFVFVIYSSSPGEEKYDPFYSFNRETGEFRDFSIFTDGNTEEILTLFKDKEGGGT